MKYVALLRGINVGGKTLIRMATLKESFEHLAYDNVRSYINSGNIMFETASRPTLALASEIEKTIEESFSLTVRVVVIAESEYRTMIANVPSGWGKKADWKYNLLFLIPPYDTKSIVEDIGELKPDIEIMKVGEGVIYQALLFSSYGKTTTGKLAARASYKQMTVRNWNTAQRLLALFDEA